MVHLSDPTFGAFAFEHETFAAHAVAPRFRWSVEKAMTRRDLASLGEMFAIPLSELFR